MTKRLILLLCFLCAAGLSAETPRQGAKAIYKLIKDREYTVLFTERYAEWHKVEGAGKRPEEAVARLSSVWELNRDMMLNIFKQLSKAKYELGTNPHAQESETGEMATALVEIGFREVEYSLYKMKNGQWGFHM